MMRRRLSLRSRLLALVLVAAVPIALCLVYLGARYYGFAVDNAYAESRSLASLTTSAIRTEIGHAEQLLAALGRIEDVKALRQGYCDRIAAAWQQQSDVRNIGLVDASGDVLCSAGPQPGAGFADAPWFLDAAKKGKYFVSDFRPAPVGGRVEAVIGLPLFDEEGKHQSTLFAVVNLIEIFRLLEHTILPSQATWVIFDGTGHILQRLPDPGSLAGQHLPETPIYREIMSQPIGAKVDSIGPDGVRRLYVAETISTARTPVYVMAGIAKDAILAGIERELRLTSVAILLILVAALLIARYAADHLLIRRIGELGQVIGNVGSGNFGARSKLEGLDDELGDLARAINAAGDTLQERARELADYLRAIDAHAIISVTDVAGNILQANEKFFEISRYSRDEVLGNNHRILNSGFHPPEFFAGMWQTISQGKIWRGDIRNRNKNGAFYWVASTIVPFLDAAGRPVRYCSVRTDITQSLAISESLQRSEERFRLLAENSLDVISVHDPAGKILYVSPSCKRVLGFAPEEMTNRDGYFFVHPDHQDKVIRLLHEPPLQGRIGECDYFKLQTKSGEFVWMEATAMPVRDMAGRLVSIQLSAREVTARKRMDDALHLHDRALAASASGLAIFRYGDLRCEYANPALAQLAELPLDAVVGSIWPVLAKMPGDDMVWQLLREAVSARDKMHGLVQLDSACADPVWCDISLTPIGDEAGASTYFVMVVVDMSEQVAIEGHLRTAVSLAEKANADKSHFLAQVSHELRTPLNAILGFAQLQEIELADAMDATQKENSGRMLRAGWHLSSLVDDMLEMTRIETGRMQLQSRNVAVSPLIHECLGLVDKSAREKGLDIRDLGDQCHGHSAFADPRRLKQVLLNLLSNAVKYNRAGGRVTITCHVMPDARLRIAVADTGIGIPIERRSELFQPFSRLGAEHSEIQGVGMGLALSRMLIEAMGGTIGVSDAAEGGSEFWIELPLATDGAGSGTEASEHRALPQAADFAAASQSGSVETSLA